jgi:hypothetical protein
VTYLYSPAGNGGTGAPSHIPAQQPQHSRRVDALPYTASRQRIILMQSSLRVCQNIALVMTYAVHSPSGAITNRDSGSVCEACPANQPYQCLRSCFAEHVESAAMLCMHNANRLHTSIAIGERASVRSAHEWRSDVSCANHPHTTIITGERA